jgi:hypothetical protein
VYDNQAGLTKTQFDKIVAQAKKIAHSPKGKKYNQQLLAQFKKPMRNILKHCTRYIDLRKYNHVEFVLKVEKDGKTSQIIAWPLNSVSNCFRILSYTTKHPKHSFNNYFYYLNLHLAPPKKPAMRMRKK